MQICKRANLPNNWQTDTNGIIVDRSNSMDPVSGRKFIMNNTFIRTILSHIQKRGLLLKL